MGELIIEERLRDLLHKVRLRAGAAFTGIGVVVASDLSDMPILPLRRSVTDFVDRSTEDVLAAMSVKESELHDGFHILSPSLRIELVAQYFAPPVSISMLPTLPQTGGARYMTALLGSRLPGVLATGVATIESKPTIFAGGLEVPSRR